MPPAPQAFAVPESDDVEVTDSEHTVDSGDEVGTSRGENLSDAGVADRGESLAGASRNDSVSKGL